MNENTNDTTVIRLYGAIVSVHSGYFFIRPTSGDPDVFASDYVVQTGRPLQGRRCTFVRGFDRSQRPCALDVQILTEDDGASVTTNDSSSGRLRGRVRKWLPYRGFGFVEPDGGGELFIHEHDVIGELPRHGSRVSYELGVSQSGRPSAINVQVED